MFKSLPEVALQAARLGATAALLFIAVNAGAQSYSPAGLEPIGQATPHQFGLSSLVVHELARDNEMDLRTIDALGKKPRANRYQATDRSGPWTLIGRIGFLNVQNQLAGNSDGMKFSLRGGGSGLGKIHIGIHRRF